MTVDGERTRTAATRRPAVRRTTAGSDYTARLLKLERSGLKRFVPTQALYRWNLRRLRLGRTLDIGCGIGRNLAHLDRGSVGVDHNPTSVETARARGLDAHTVDGFRDSEAAREGAFDTLLCVHVLEHLTREQAPELLRAYLPYVRPGGRVVLITPQEAGYLSDPTHVRFVDFAVLRHLATGAGLAPRRAYSFPLPRSAGRLFRHNEFVYVARVPHAGAGQ